GARAFRHFLHRFPAGAFRLVRGVRALAPDLIAAHCSKFHAPYVATLRAALGVPVVAHLHNGPQTADGPESLVLSRLLLRSARRVIAVSPAVADYARRARPAPRPAASRGASISSGTSTGSRWRASCAGPRLSPSLRASRGTHSSASRRCWRARPWSPATFRGCPRTCATGRPGFASAARI